jgi:hypothetical protein
MRVRFPFHFLTISTLFILFTHPLAGAEEILTETDRGFREPAVEGPAILEEISADAQDSTWENGSDLGFATEVTPNSDGEIDSTSL